MLGLEGHVPRGLSARGAQRVAGAPQLGPGAERAGWRAGSGRKFRASRSFLRTCSGEQARFESPRGRCTGFAGSPFPGLVLSARLRALPAAAGLCGAHPGTRATQRGLSPHNQRGSKRERETETCCRGQGSREEGTAVHARKSASDPARQVPAGCEECGARRARAHLEPAPARELRAQPRFPPAPLCSHFPGSRASRLRPRPAPERRPHSAAAGWRAPRERAPRPRRRGRPSEGS